MDAGKQAGDFGKEQPCCGLPHDVCSAVVAVANVEVELLHELHLAYDAELLGELPHDLHEVQYSNGSVIEFCDDEPISCSWLHQ